jgi:hypothetical protein
MDWLQHKLRRGCAIQNAFRCHRSAIRWQAMRSAYRDAGVLRWQVPRPLRHVVVDGVEHVQQELRHRHAEPQPQRRDARRARWLRVPAARGAALLRDRRVPCALRHVVVVGVEHVQQELRHRHAEPQPQRRDARRARWLRVPAARGAALVRDRRVPCGLRAVAVVRVERMLEDVRRWRTDQESHRGHCCAGRRQGMRRAQCSSSLHRWQVPCALRRVELEQLVYVHKNLRCGHAESLA